MDLHSDHPYWLLRHGIINSYSSLSKSISTRVVVIGAGVSGALTAWHLCQRGIEVVVVDRRHLGMGSTCASTGLLQYEIDTPLHKLINKVGEVNAVRSYHLCREAITEVGRICRKIKVNGVFTSKPSFQYASYIKDINDLEKEFLLRKKNGFNIEWLTSNDIEKKFGFTKQAGLLSSEGAELDAYKFTHALFNDAVKKGLQLFDHTEISEIIHLKKGVKLVTKDNHLIKADKLIIACGYESQRYIDRQVQKLHSTYAIASEKKVEKNYWYKNSLIWETAEPYVYIRTTSDNRILIGGKDIPFTNPVKRDKLIGQKSKSLEKSFQQLFPLIKFKTDFRWAGNFASTKDGLPYIGSISKHPDTFFALGYGGNGITFSLIAAKILSDTICRKRNPDAAIFSFDR